MVSGPKHLVVFGSQGAGKGTQARLLSKHFGVVYIGLGDMLREMASEKGPMAKRIDEALLRGHLVPDELASEIAGSQLGNIPPATGFVLDGYPRSVAQAALLKRTLTGLGRLNPKPIFINLQVPKRQLLDRLQKRRQIEKRHDDIKPVIDQRLSTYHEQTKPVLDSIKEWAEVVDINANQPIESVTKDIIAAIESGS